MTSNLVPFNDPDVITAHDVAEILQVKVERVYYYSKMYGLPSYKVFGKRLFKKSEVDNFLKEKLNL